MDRLIFRLRDRDARSEGLSTAGLNGAIASVGLFLLLNFGDPLQLFGLLAFISGVFGCVIGVIQAVRGREDGDLEIDAEHLKAFPNEMSKRRITVPLTDIRGLLVRANDRGARAFIGHRNGTIVIDARDFAEPGDLARMALALRERIGRLPNGAERLRYLEEQMEIARFTAGRRPYVTYAMLGLVGAAYMLQMRANALADPLEMIRLGAGVPALVEQGEWFRMVSANFLHGANFHIGLNAIGLWILGGLVERVAGPWQLGVVALLSALGGAVTSTLLSSAPIMVGASTTLYGLFGALLVIQRVYRWQIPPVFRESIRWLIILLVVNVVITIPIPQIDKAAHAGGFVAGALAMYLMIGRDRRYRPQRKAAVGIRAVAIGLCVVFAAGLFQAARTAADFQYAPALRVLRDHPDVDPTTLNNTAWMTLIRPDASPETLAICLEMAQMAVERSKESPEPALREPPSFLDTRAGALYRVGRSREAIADELRALSRDRTTRAIYVAHIRKMAGTLPEVAGLTRAGEVLQGQPAWANKVAVAEVDEGGLRGVIIGRFDADGRMATEKSGLAADATVSLRWVEPLDLGEWLPAGQWRWYPQTKPGELP